MTPVIDAFQSLVSRYNAVASLVGLQTASAGVLETIGFFVSQYLYPLIVSFLGSSSTSGRWAGWRFWMANNPYDQGEVLGYTSADWTQWQNARYGFQLPDVRSATMLMPLSDFFSVANLIIADAHVVCSVNNNTIAQVSAPERRYYDTQNKTYQQALQEFSAMAWSSPQLVQQIGWSVFRRYAYAWSIDQYWNGDGVRCTIPNRAPYTVYPALAQYASALSPRVAWSGTFSTRGSGVRTLDSLGVPEYSMAPWDTHDVSGGVPVSALMSEMAPLDPARYDTFNSRYWVRESATIIDLTPILR